MRRISAFLIWAALCAAVYCLFIPPGRSFGWLEISVFMGVFAFLVYPSLLDLHLTFWRLFLDCYLDRDSFAYRLFYRGTFIRVMTLFSAMISSYLAFYTFLMAGERPEMPLTLAAGALALIPLFDRDNFRVPILAKPLKRFFAKYLAAFYLALVSAALLTIIDFARPETIAIDEIFIRSAEAVSSGRVSFHPIRVLARHEYAFEILLRQLITVDYVKYAAGLALFISAFGACFGIMLAVRRAYGLPLEVLEQTREQ
ncbi:hypothetical protein C4J81_09210 [Deltaproteobacteria bacterium Smac51]|nr:hypothetical protein C4J81_09210 [Deltaproteobacteria bacterium Smac51]